MLKGILTKLAPTLKYYYSYLGYRLFVYLAVSTLVGLLDGLGLAMFLPLLEIISAEDSSATGEGLGNLQFIMDILSYFNLPLTLVVILLTMLAFFIMKGAAIFVATYIGVLYQKKFIKAIRYESIDALSRFQYNEFVHSDAGQIQNGLTSESLKVTFSFKHYIEVQQQVILVLAYVFLAFIANAEFALFVVIGGFFTNLFFRILFKRTKRLSLDMVGANNRFQSLLLQSVQFFKYLKATNGFSQYSKHLKYEISEVVEKEKSMGVLNSIMSGLREPTMMLVVISVIVINVYLLDAALGTVILSLLFFYRGMSAVMNLQGSYNKFLTMSGSIVKFQEFITHLKSYKDQKGSENIESLHKEIEIRDLDYTVRTENGMPLQILYGINLKIEKNAIIAVVGESGSGKTTLVNLISGLLRPSKGLILIDGIDSSKLNLSSFQNRIGYITQEAVIFDDTVFNNVSNWSVKNAENLARFWDALEKAQIDNFVKELPLGLDSRLGNNGISMSGGQKQRISIARELYKDIDLLFMDEATSALDSETERAIQTSIDNLKGRYTIIMIAHRLSTIKNADIVIVMNKGKIEAMGSYSELLKESVSFSKMVELQEL